MAKCKNCKHFYKRPDITMFTCAEGKPHEDNTVIDCDNYAPITNADRIRNMTDEELARFIVNLENHFGEEYEGEQSCLAWLHKESEGSHDGE